MGNEKFSSTINQHDPKEFRESFGSFGTTTNPNARDHLSELQAMVRRGVKHVEIHLAGTGKGNFGVQDVPDKYGFEQKRTIMQLAKLNNQTLSVHANFNTTSFSGLTQRGFDEAERANNIRELDESLKFAAETAKGGAVVFHIQGDMPSSRGNLNVSKEYLDWLKENNFNEYQRIKEDYFDKNPLHRRFVDNIEQEKEAKLEFEELLKNNPTKAQEFIDEASSSKDGRSAWEYYYQHKAVEKAKVAPDMNPLIVIGDQISQVERQQEFIDFEILTGKNKSLSLNSQDKKILSDLGIDTNKNISVEEYQRATAIFTNGLPDDLKNKVSLNDFKNLKNKLLVNYDRVLQENDNLQGQSDKVFFEKLNDTQIELAKMQKERLSTKYKMFKDDLRRLKELEDENKRVVNSLDNVSGDSDLDLATRDVIKQDISVRNNQIQQLIQGVIGYSEYQELAKYDETISQLNKQISQLEERKGNVKSLTDESFKKNTTAMAHLATKALRYQLNLKEKSKSALEKKEEINSRVQELQKQYDLEKDVSKQNQIHTQIQKERYKLKQIVGLKDYDDIDLIDRPLYLAPENMLPGYGSLTSMEEFKATMRMSQEEFAKKILSDELEYKKLREDYQKETGIEIKTHEDAIKLAKRHLAGTFDNAHAAVWLKHFRKEEGESEEHRIDRFNNWLNTQAEDMYKEGLIRHVHFNDTSGKDDDHNLLGQGILDIHDLRERLRKAGMKEALIVEAGGRGANNVLHLQNAWDIFNPSLFADHNSTGGTGYKLQSENPQFVGGTNVSDWMSVKRDYQNRPQYSQYGLGYTAFGPKQPQQGQPRGSWSGQSFL